MRASAWPASSQLSCGQPPCGGKPVLVRTALPHRVRTAPRRAPIWGAGTLPSISWTLPITARTSVCAPRAIPCGEQQNGVSPVPGTAGATEHQLGPVGFQQLLAQSTDAAKTQPERGEPGCARPLLRDGLRAPCVAAAGAACWLEPDSEGLVLPGGFPGGGGQLSLTPGRTSPLQPVHSQQVVGCLWLPPGRRWRQWQSRAAESSVAESGAVDLVNASTP